jgi:hypothetical protein
LADKQHKFANSARSYFRACLAAFRAEPMTSGKGVFFGGDMPFILSFTAPQYKNGSQLSLTFVNTIYNDEY